MVAIKVKFNDTEFYSLDIPEEVSLNEIANLASKLNMFLALKRMQEKNRDGESAVAANTGDRPNYGIFKAMTKEEAAAFLKRRYLTGYVAALEWAKDNLGFSYNPALSKTVAAYVTNKLRTWFDLTANDIGLERFPRGRFNLKEYSKTQSILEQAKKITEINKTAKNKKFKLVSSSLKGGKNKQ